MLFSVLCLVSKSDSEQCLTFGQLPLPSSNMVAEANGVPCLQRDWTRHDPTVKAAVLDTRNLDSYTERLVLKFPSCVQLINMIAYFVYSLEPTLSTVRNVMRETNRHGCKELCIPWGVMPSNCTRVRTRARSFWLRSVRLDMAESATVQGKMETCLQTLSLLCHRTLCWSCNAEGVCKMQHDGLLWYWHVGVPDQHLTNGAREQDGLLYYWHDGMPDDEFCADQSVDQCGQCDGSLTFMRV